MTPGRLPTMSPDPNSPSHEASPPGRDEAGWPWLPISDGALRRDLVNSVRLERTDGDFKGGYKSMWTIVVTTALHGDGLPLRPVFFDAVELCKWVDLVFPGAAFGLLPPRVVTDSPESAATFEGEGKRYAYGSKITDAIRTIGDGLAGGNQYEPAQGYRPPPGAPPVAV